MPELSLREFRFPEDLPTVIDLWQDSGPGVKVGRSDEPAELQKKWQHDPELFLVAELDGIIVGTVIGGFDGRRGMIYHLAVRTGLREHGIGKRLMDEVEARLKAKGCLKAYLLVRDGNDGAMRFYEHQGWQVMKGVQLFGKDLA